MNRKICGECVQGASHVRNNVVCQDSYKKVEISEDIVILSVADGHGSSSCPFSKTGSTIATNVFCKVISDLVENYKDNMDILPTFLNREGETKVAQSIDAEWKRRVWKTHLDNKREKPVDENGEVDKKAVYKQYGTTLLGLLITSSFIFAFQLGDGDIMFVDKENVYPVIEGDKILGTETHSLSRTDSWKHAITMIRMRDVTEDIPYLYMLSTDGFANSYFSQAEFYKTCRDYYAIIAEHGFRALADNLKDWLKETTELGCGDDITVLISCFEEVPDAESRGNSGDFEM